MTIEYILAPRTNGANPFKIFESIKSLNQSDLSTRIRAMDYGTFLKSAYWFGVAMVAKSEAGMRCQVCNSQDRIEVHHRTYDTHGLEHENMRDLVVLCHHCHGLFHGHVSKQPEKVMAHGRIPKRKPARELEQVFPDTKLPDGDWFKITDALLDNLRTNGAFTTATMTALGIQKPLQKGWAKELIGQLIRRETYLNALAGRGVYAGRRGK